MIMYILKKLEWVAHTLLKNYEGHFEEVSKSPPVHESPQLRSIGWRIQIWQSRGKSSSSKNFDLTWPDLLGLKLFSSFQFVMILANKDCRIKRALYSSESQCVGVIYFSSWTNKITNQHVWVSAGATRDGREHKVCCTSDTGSHCSSK